MAYNSLKNYFCKFSVYVSYSIYNLLIVLKSLIKHIIATLSMSQTTPEKQTQDFHHNLDNSIYEEDSHQYKRDSTIQCLEFQSDNFKYSPRQNYRNNQSQRIRNSNSSEEGDFAYHEYSRMMRHSFKSQEDFELQYINGDLAAHNHNVNRQRNSQNHQIKIVDNYKNSSLEKNLSSNQKSIVQTQNTAENSQYLKQSQSELINHADFSPQQENSSTYKFAQKNLPLSATKDNEVAKTEKDVVDKIQKTPKKQQFNKKISQQQKQQWSIQSNNSVSSPQTEPENLKIIQFQQLAKKLAQRQVTQQTHQIKSIKQRVFSINEPQSFGSSMKSWFRLLKLQPQKLQNLTKKDLQFIEQKKNQDAKQKYRLEMQLQMQEVKNSLSQYQKINQFATISNKQKQKHKINKTHVLKPVSKKLLQVQTQEMVTDQYRMLLKISFEKKKENYQMLKQWDKRRAQSINLHRNIIEMLQNQIDKRIKASLQNFEIYTHFFKEKLKQQEKFVNSPIINTKYALQNSAISKNIYINCSVILNSLSEQNQAKCKKIQDFITLIKNSVIKDLTDKHLHESQRQLLKVREKISTLKSSLKKCNTETSEKTQQLAKLFSQSANNLSIKSAQDFYSAQLDFLRCSSQQMLVQKRLGENCIEYYNTALNEELKRTKIIKEALITYSKGLQQTYNFQLEYAGLEQLLKNQQTSLIKEFYSLDDMLDERSRKVLKQKFKIPEHEDLSINYVSNFIQNFKFENFNNRMLLLKQFNAKYYDLNGSKNLKSAIEQNCKILVTVDFYIHLFFSCEKLTDSFQADASLKIVPKQIEIKPQRDEFIDIIKKTEKRSSMISYFWEAKNQKSYRVKFASKDAKQQFCDFVKKLLF